MAILSRTTGLLLAGLALLAGLGEARAENLDLDEYQVKAAYLYNFTKFVEWPPEAFDGPSTPIGICILGMDPFGGALENSVRGKTAGNRGLVVRAIAGAREARGCHILFAARGEQKRLPALLRDAQWPYILTVGESAGFFDSSAGIINFVLKDARVRIQVNPDAAAQARLHISSKLLSLAEIKKASTRP
jgi:hypothetical protein